MEIRVEHSAFAPAFRRLARLIPSRTPKPVLQNVLLEAPPGADPIVRLTATDLEITASVTVPAQVDTPGRCLVPAARMGQILTAVPGGAFRLEVDGGELVVGTGLFNATGTHALAAESPEDFPAVDLDLEDTPGLWKLPASLLVAAVGATIEATDIDSTRYALSGVRFEPVKGGRGLEVVSTDGRRLHRATLEAAVSVGEPFTPTAHGGILPTRAAKLFADILRDHGHAEVSLTLGPSRITCTVGGAKLAARPVEGRFPAWRDVFPSGKPAATVTFVTPEDLTGLFRQAAITTSEESRGVMLEADQAGVTLSSRSADVGRARVDGTTLSFAGEPQWALIDARYPEEALDACAKAARLEADPDAPAEPVEVQLRGPKDAVVVRCGAVQVVLMPLTIEGDPGLHRAACKAALAARQRRTVEETEALESAGAI